MAINRDCNFVKRFAAYFGEVTIGRLTDQNARRGILTVIAAILEMILQFFMLIRLHAPDVGVILRAAFKEGEIMKRGLAMAMVVCLGLGASTLWQKPVFASSETATYQLHMEAPQITQAANGDIVSITGSGVFSVNPKTVSATGTFTSQSSGSGTWVATQLLDFQPYGCGILFGTPLPPNLCGGKLILRVVLTDSTSGQQFDGTIWVTCVIGPNIPNSVQEGARLNIVGVNNFNNIVSGDNVYVKTS